MSSLNINRTKTELSRKKYDLERDRVLQYEAFWGVGIAEKDVLRDANFSDDPLVIEARICAETLSEILWHRYQIKKDKEHKIPEALKANYIYKICAGMVYFIESSAYTEIENKIWLSDSVLAKKLLKLISELSDALHDEMIDDETDENEDEDDE